MSKTKFFFIKKNIKPSENLDKVVELVGGGSVINGAYPVYLVLEIKNAKTTCIVKQLVLL